MEQDPALTHLFAAGLAYCQTTAMENSTTLISLFLAGLAGSATHCAGMCGPFVLSQVTARLKNIPASEMHEFHRLKGAALAPYHFGRLTTYMVLGGAASFLTGGIFDLMNLGWVAAILLIFAALFFAGYALQRLGLSLPHIFNRNEQAGNGLLARKINKISHPLFSNPTGWRGYGLGLTLGFLPCGLLYGALAAASAPGNVVAGIFAMGAFGLGTMPALLGIGFSGHVAGGRWLSVTHWLAPMLLLINSAGLLFTAWRLI